MKCSEVCSTSTTVRASLPVVTSSHAPVRSLWQVDSLARQVVIDDAVVGVVQTGMESTLHAVSALSGNALWTLAVPVAELKRLVARRVYKLLEHAP
jgi:hypothetical protein